MTDRGFLRQHEADLKQLSGEQRMLHERLAANLRWAAPLRLGLGTLTGALDRRHEEAINHGQI